MSATSYDVVSYPSHPLPQTHPDRLAAIGVFMGLNSAPAAKCRVLELGGGDGANTVPMALTYPASSFLGVDLAASAVAHGNALAQELGLTNIELRAANLLDFPAGAGQFDYIIAHGLYSWVPQFVRDKVMAVCRDHLAPQGIAYISYNALPGCHFRRLLWDMMRYHVRHIDDPAKRIEQARVLMQFLAAGKAKDDDPYSRILNEEVKRVMLDKDEAVLYHDDLAEVNDPFFFHEFMAQATAHGLQYLAEADFFEMTDHLYPPEVRAMLAQLGERDPLQREQYLDFLKCRRFRQTLLVRREVALDRQPKPERIRQLWVASRAKPTSAAPNLAAGAKESFKEVSGGAMTLDLPLAKAALLHLGEVYPLPLRFAELAAAARSRPGMPVGEVGDLETLAEILLAAHAVGLVELQHGPPAFVRRPSEKPVSSPLARLQLRKGADLVTTLRHTPVRVDNPLSRELILMLDGTRDRDALHKVLIEWAVANPPTGQTPPPEAELRAKLGEQIEPGLQSVAALGLLVR